MKVIYMQDTIQLMSKGNAQGVEDLISSGVVKQTEESINYLLTIIEDEDTGSTVVQEEV
jgi:hypothetical protein